MATPVVSRTVLPPIATDGVHVHSAVGRWTRRLLIVLVLAGVVSGVRLYFFKPALVSVTVTRVGVGRVEELVTNNKAGTIVARRRAALSPEVGGRVVTLPVEEGDHVRKGALLLAVSDLEVRSQVALQEQSLAASRAAAREACANADLAARDHDRLQTLLGGGFVSRQTVDEAANRRVTSNEACIAATARIAQAAAAVDVARATLAKAELRAPFDGVVSRVSTHMGEWISPSPSGLTLPVALEMIDPTSIYLRAPLDEVDAGRVRPAFAARITLDAFPGRAFSGRVTRIGAYVSEVQQQNRTFDIDVTFDDPTFARTLLPGTSADVEVILRARDGVVRVPTSAILQGGRVLVVREGVLTSVPIQVGLTNWEVSEITSGLRAGDAIVTSLDRPEVREGARARVDAQTSMPERSR